MVNKKNKKEKIIKIAEAIQVLLIWFVWIVIVAILVTGGAALLFNGFDQTICGFKEAYAVMSIAVGMILFAWIIKKEKVLWE